MSKVTIHKHGGGSFTIPEANLENTRRLLGSQIKSVEFEDMGKNESALIEALDMDDDPIIEVIETNPEKNETALTLDDLKNTDKDVLRKLADDIADSKKITKANGRAGIEKLAEYVFNNQ